MGDHKAKYIKLVAVVSLRRRFPHNKILVKYLAVISFKTAEMKKYASVNTMKQNLFSWTDQEILVCHV